MMHLKVDPRKRSRRSIALFISSFVAFSITVSASDSNSKQIVDPESGMIIAENWQLVHAMCSACHSPQLITSYGGTRESWASLIDWMQETQGLWPIEASIEDKILTYLAKSYPPGEASRRRNLSISVRPPNPYVSAVKAEFKAKLEQGEVEGPGSEPK